MVIELKKIEFKIYVFKKLRKIYKWILLKRIVLYT